MERRGARLLAAVGAAHTVKNSAEAQTVGKLPYKKTVLIHRTAYAGIAFSEYPHNTIPRRDARADLSRDLMTAHKAVIFIIIYQSIYNMNFY